MNDSTFEAPPIVLVHGLCGLSRLFAKRRPAKEYFPGVRAYLESLGHEVLMPRISATAAITTRAVIRWFSNAISRMPSRSMPIAARVPGRNAAPAPMAC